MNDVESWYENSYKSAGFKAQRRYPNEELLRFLGVNFIDKPHGENRKNIKILEVGCGSCANLWMIAKEGFDAHGLDLSSESLVLGKRMLNNWGVKATLKQGSFLDLPYENSSFDVVIDVFSMNCVNHNNFLIGLDEVYRVLKRNGLFFSYTPSKNSSTFKNYLPAKKIDSCTLNGIYRESSPFSGNHYPFHFWDIKEYQRELNSRGFSVNYSETVQKSYYQRQDKFEHVVVHAKK
jgi:ubiquinone/menaquinone biosynthesis C-methylase UbiE